MKVVSQKTRNDYVKNVMQKNIKIVSIFVLLLKELKIGILLVIIMHEWLHYWLEQSYFVQIFEDIFSRKNSILL